MGRDKSDAWREFEDVPSDSFKCPRVECNHCGYQIAAQVAKLENHLRRCDLYKRRLATRTQHQEAPLDSHTHRCGPLEKAKLDKLLGLALFGGGLPFSTFDKWCNPDMHAFLQALNSAYPIPERHVIANRLLPECHIDVENKVNALLVECQWLNFTIDESDDKARRRIANLSVNVPSQGSFFLRNYHTQANRQTADFLVQLTAPGIIEACNGDVTRCNSIATDTCAAMRSFHTKMSADPRFKDCFFVLCDSHGIQLLIKRVIELVAYQQNFKKAQSIAGAFSHSRLQLAILREKQTELYGRTYAITLSVITRWGSQYNLLSSLKRSKDALKAYAVDSRALISKDKTDITSTLLDRAFWNDVEDLEEIIRPLHEAQLSSEDDNAHLGHVTKRWLEMKSTMTTLHQGGTQGLDDVIKPDGIWAELYHQQTTDIHWVAYFLDPENAGAVMTESVQNAVFTFMRRYIHVSDGEWYQIVSDFWDFHLKQGRFPPNESNGIWSETIVKNPRIFWMYCRVKSSHLAGFALRIFSTPASSVPSERAFSAMNFILDKFRASMKVERSNKAIYIYMNQRALRRAAKKSEGLYKLSDDESLQLEEEVLAMIESKQELNEES